MLKRFLAFLFVGALLLGVGFFFQQNPAIVELHLTPSRSYSLPLPLLMLACFFVGATAVFLLALIRETQWTLAERRRARREARRQRAGALVADGRKWLWHGRPDRAKRAIGRAPAGERGVEPALWLAENALAAERPDEARLLLDDALAVQGDDPRLLAMLAEVHAAEHDAPRATALLERAVERAPDSPRLAAALRDAYVRERRWQDALATETRYLALVRSSSEAAGEQSRLAGLRYELALERESPEESVRDLRALARSAPAFLPAAVSLGEILHRLERRAEAARAWLRAATLRPEPVLLDRIESVYRELGRPRKVVALYERLRRRADAPFLVARLARFLLAENQPAEAAAALDRMPPAVADAADTALERELRLLRAEVHRRLGESEGALQKLEESFERAERTEYACAACERMATSWSARCPACGLWDSLQSRRGAPTPAPSRWQGILRWATANRLY